jgi:hypothetical protein
LAGFFKEGTGFFMGDARCRYEFFDRRFAVISFRAYGKYLCRWRLTAGKKIAERYLFAVCSVSYLPEVFICRVSFPLFAESCVVAGFYAVRSRQTG